MVCAMVWGWLIDIIWWRIPSFLFRTERNTCGVALSILETTLQAGEDAGWSPNFWPLCGTFDCFSYLFLSLHSSRKVWQRISKPSQGMGKMTSSHCQEWRTEIQLRGLPPALCRQEAMEVQAASIGKMHVMLVSWLLFHATMAEGLPEEQWYGKWCGEGGHQHGILIFFT